MFGTAFMPEKLSDAETKRILKEALQEWLDGQFARFGKWTLAGLVSAAFAGLVWVWLSAHGWHQG